MYSLRRPASRLAVDEAEILQCCCRTPPGMSVPAEVLRCACRFAFSRRLMLHGFSRCVILDVGAYFPTLLYGNVNRITPTDAAARRYFAARGSARQMRDAASPPLLRLQRRFAPLMKVGFRFDSFLQHRDTPCPSPLPTFSLRRPPS